MMAARRQIPGTTLQTLDDAEKPPKEFLARSFVLATYGLFTVYVQLHELWISLNLLLSRFLTRPSAVPQHKIALIGDGFARGVGDWVVVAQKAGAAGYLQQSLERNIKVRRRWGVYNCGSTASTSEDWIPHAIRVEKDAAAKPGLFEDIFSPCSKHPAADAEVVVLVVGFNDHKRKGNSIPIEDTVTNIQRICKA